jgi:hypothetical protein
MGNGLKLEEAIVISNMIGEFLAEDDPDDRLDAVVGFSTLLDDTYVVEVKSLAMSEDINFCVMDMSTAAEDIAFIVFEIRKYL